MASPPASPHHPTAPRPMSAMIRPTRSQSRLSMSSRPGGSRASDEDSKTAVKVAIRVRPALRPSDPGYELIPQRFQKSALQVTSSTSLAVDSPPQGKKIFVFDRVFPEDITQEGIWDYLQESVQGFTQGYNVSILAYGQSGAGKSYTMGTACPADNFDQTNVGIIPRAAAALFEALGLPPMGQKTALKAPSRYSIGGPPKGSSTTKNWTLKATYVEIYNEQLRDLLCNETRLEDRPQVSIREDKSGRILLTGLHEMEINTYDDLMHALHHGSSIRQTDATAMNAKSSRSHAVFSLNLVQKKPRAATEKEKRQSLPLDMIVNGGEAGYMTVDSKLHFVDLAGSERLKNTMAQGERAKEGISINAGLASLGKVISQLSSRNPGSHVSYRDSKLTRLLQDSLGGNAITYMVACVTPAEFHLSETLNTVQYAQRARAIQSKPRIQQVSEDGDTKAVIDRLRAEIAFLREQLRNSNTSDTSERARKVSQDRPERTNERENELQNQLLDLQENYGALSQRHARLISELARAQEVESTSAPSDYSDTAVERLKRSNSFAEAVEQVVLEYEKTIQSLESSLSNTRSSLSTTESSLLEKETKLAYIETVNHQLQSRLQKMIDRESATENYLNDIEAKLDGHTSGEEKNATIIAELRKEILRIRDNESSCEEYISTLEERLAEADHNIELMTGELARLENVVERQRNLGKLDSLISGISTPDNRSKNGSPVIDQAGFEKALTNGNSNKLTLKSNVSQETIAEEKEPSPTKESAPVTVRARRASTRARELPDVSITANGLSAPIAFPPQSPAQTEFVHDKLENVQQELFELKVEHESTLNDMEQLSHNYEAAMLQIARMQDEADEYRRGKPNVDTPRTVSPPPSPSRMRPVSFLAGTRVSELKGELDLPSRSLSSELSLVVESPYGESAEVESELFKQELETLRSLHQEHQEKEEALSAEMESIRKEHLAKQERIAALQEERDRILNDHKEALELMENLKSDVAKARTSTTQSTHLIRRKSSQSLMMLDRVQRSFGNLRKLLLPYLEDNFETLECFDTNIDEAMHELMMRSERIGELENEINGLRRDLESKSTMISGLTRERTSKSSSPLDITVVAAMERKIDEAELETQYLKRQLADREEEHTKELESLREELSESVNQAKSLVAALMEVQTKLAESANLTDAQSQTIVRLQQELADASEKHTLSVETLRHSEQSLMETITELEASMARLEESHIAAANQASADLERSIDEHQANIDSHKATITAHLARIAELEESSNNTVLTFEGKLAAVEENSRTEVSKHRDTISQISGEVSEKIKMIASYESRLESLQASLNDALAQVKRLEESEATAQAALKASEVRVAELIAEAAVRHAQEETARISLEAELQATKESYEQRLSSTRTILDESHKTAASQTRRLEMLEKSLLEAQNTIDALEKNRDEVATEHIDSTESAAALSQELTQAKKQIAQQVETVKELQELHAQAQAQVEKLSRKEAKHARIIEDLEQQLAFTFDQNQESTQKLLTVNAELEQIKAERTALVSEAAKKGNDLRLATETLNDEILLSNNRASARAERSNSMTNKDLRKSASATSLPSPPPAIPLPPLPTNGSANPPSAAAAPVSPNMSRRPSKDYVAAHIEDQDARIKTLEKQLLAEKALTQTLEEALTDCEKTMKRLTADRESLQAKAAQVQQELDRAKNDSQNSRYSMQAVEDERLARIKAEQARAQLEQRMEALNRKNKRSFACF
ncbi:hypothetical protein DFH27DRAFT_479935 [Peziza echinospora]|nr:hypothetical protein DFH27DRAFT_479935 [Peziza echinospora]